MDKREQIWRSLEDPEYRRIFAEDVGTGLAFQTKLMREARGWTQEELGRRAGGIKQEFISQLESPDYGRHSLTTLKKLAAAFDVGLIVRFAPFSELVDWIVNLTSEKLTPPGYEEEARQMTFAEVSDNPDWSYEIHTQTLEEFPFTNPTSMYLDASALEYIHTLYPDRPNRLDDSGVSVIAPMAPRPREKESDFAVAA